MIRPIAQAASAPYSFKRGFGFSPYAAKSSKAPTVSPPSKAHAKLLPPPRNPTAKARKRNLRPPSPQAKPSMPATDTTTKPANTKNTAARPISATIPPHGAQPISILNSKPAPAATTLPEPSRFSTSDPNTDGLAFPPKRTAGASSNGTPASTKPHPS